MRQLKSVFFLLALGVISVLAVLAQDSPLPMPTAVSTLPIETATSEIVVPTQTEVLATVTEPVEPTLPPLATELPTNAVSPEVTVTPEEMTLTPSITPLLTETPVFTETADASAASAVLPPLEPLTPQIAGLISPSPNEITDNVLLTFLWVENASAIRYRLVIQKLDGTLIFRQPYEIADVCSDGICMVDNIGIDLPNDVYRWRVAIVKANSEPEVTGWSHFTISNVGMMARSTSFMNPDEVIIYVGHPYTGKKHFVIFDGIKPHAVIRQDAMVGDRQMTDFAIWPSGDVASESSENYLTRGKLWAALSYNGAHAAFICVFGQIREVCLADITKDNAGNYVAANLRTVTSTGGSRAYLGGWSPLKSALLYWTPTEGSVIYDIQSGLKTFLPVSKLDLRWEADGYLYFVEELGMQYGPEASNGPQKGIQRLSPSTGFSVVEQVMNPNQYPVFKYCANHAKELFTARLAHSTYTVNINGDVLTGLQLATRFCIVNSKMQSSSVIKRGNSYESIKGALLGLYEGPNYVTWSADGAHLIKLPNPTHFAKQNLDIITLIPVQAGEHPYAAIQFVGSGTIALGKYLKDSITAQWVKIAPYPPPPTPTPTFTPTPSPTPPYCDELTPTATWEMPTQEPIGTPVVIVIPTRCPVPFTCVDPPFPTTVAMSAPQSLNSDVCVIRPTATPIPTVTPTPTETTLCRVHPNPEKTLYGYTTVEDAISSLTIPAPTITFSATDVLRVISRASLYANVVLVELESTPGTRYWIDSGSGVTPEAGANCDYLPFETNGMYAVRIIDDETRTWDQKGTTEYPDFGNPGFERQSIVTALQEIGTAFNTLLPTVSTSQAAFNHVMLERSGTEILLIRTASTSANITITNYTYLFGENKGQTVNLTYPNADPGNCLSSQEGLVGTTRQPAAIICNGHLKDNYDGTVKRFRATQYTIVHELGHLFDYRTSYPDPVPDNLDRRSGGLSGPIGNFELQDCGFPEPGTVMGFFVNGWTRGRRGWGTGPQQYYDDNQIPRPLITDFQQNPSLSLVEDTAQIEAAADSFLNWVYRFNNSNSIEVNPPCALTPTPSGTPWSGPGYLNLQWNATPAAGFVADSRGVAGAPDSSLPGDVRYFDIHLRIQELLENRDE